MVAAAHLRSPACSARVRLSLCLADGSWMVTQPRPCGGFFSLPRTLEVLPGASSGGSDLVISATTVSPRTLLANLFAWLMLAFVRVSFAMP